MNKTLLLSVATLASAAQARDVLSVIEPLAGERWYGASINYGAHESWDNRHDLFQPFKTIAAVDQSRDGNGGSTSPFFVSTAGRYVWGERPFVYAFTNGTMYVTAGETIAPVVAGKTLKEAYLAASAKHFPFTGVTPAELLFTKPQWNNWIEIAIFGMTQQVVDEYTEALAKNGFPCGVYMMDGGWLSHSGSYKFDHERFPDPKAMFRRIHDHGWKSMIWTAHFMSPDSLEHKRLRHGKGYNKNDDGCDYLCYRRYVEGKPAPKWNKQVGVIWWWSGVSATWDLTYRPAWEHYAKTLRDFATEYGIDGFKFDAGDIPRLWEVRFHDSKMEPCDFANAYVRVGVENFPYNEYRCGWRTGGLPVMQRLHDQGHTWKALKSINANMLVSGLLGSPYVVADMVGGGLAGTYRPGSKFSEKLFLRMAAQQALHPMMQFSAAPWRYLSSEGAKTCRKFAELHVEYGPKIYALAQHAAKTGEPIMRTMEYEFPHQGFEDELTQYMLGSDLLVANVVNEDDSLTVRLPAGKWLDDLGETHIGPKVLELKNVPVDRLPRYVRETVAKPRLGRVAMSRVTALQRLHFDLNGPRFTSIRSRGAK